MNKNQLCYFIATSSGARAIPLHFRALADELARRGDRVVMILDENRDVPEDHTKNPAVYNWPSGRPTKLRDALFLRNLIRTYRPACMIGNFGSVNLIVLVGWLMRVRTRITWYHTLTQQVDMDADALQATPHWKIALLRLRKRLVYRLATHVVPVSHAAADDVHRHFGVPAHKRHVLHNSLADPMAGVELPPRVPNVVVCTGRLYPSKGQRIVIEALALVKDTLPALHIEFLGHGPSKDDLIQFAQAKGVADRCSFAGKLPLVVALKRVAAAQAVIVPSRSEAFGMVTIESLAMGTPVIATATGGTLDIVRDGLDGLLFPPGDAQQLASKLEYLLTQPDLVDRMSKSARERFLTTFEQRRLIGAQADWIEAVAGRSDRSVSATPSRLDAAPADDRVV